MNSSPVFPPPSAPSPGARPPLPPLPPLPLSPSLPSAPPTPPGRTRWAALPRLSAAGWLATTGAALLLLASVVVVAGRWTSITPEMRFAGLVASLLAVYFTAETLRQRLGTTAAALAVLAATITAPVGIAAAATLEQPWPVCVLVGGILAFVATEVQSHRWSIRTLRAATVVATGLAASGIAALTDVPVALAGAVASAAALALGAERRSVVLAAASGAVPFLVVLADAGVGSGTLARIGAIGASLGWSAPAASVLAATVIAVSAHRRSSLALVGLAVSTLSIGATIGLFRLEPVAAVWWSIPALIVLMLQALAATRADTVWRMAARAAAEVAVIPLAFGAAVSPLVAFSARSIGQYPNAEPIWVLPAIVAAIALFAACSSGRQSERSRVALFVAACLASVAAALVVGADLYGWDDVAVLWAIAALCAAVGRARGVAWLHGAGTVVVAAVGATSGVAELSAGGAALVLVAVATTATGVAFRSSGITPVHTIAAGSAVLSLLVAFGAEPHVQSLVAAVVAAQFTLSAVSMRRQFAAAAGAVVATTATISLWWTTGTNDAVIAWLAPYGADGGDVALGVAVLSLLVAGGLLRRVQPTADRVSSWLAYSPGLGMAAAWLLDAQFDGDGLWATVGGLTVGIVAVGIGGWRRLGAPLVCGTALIGASVLASVGPRLASAPTWMWIAAGGATLLVLAALIERSDRSVLVADPESDAPTIVQQFFRGFE